MEVTDDSTIFLNYDGSSDIKIKIHDGIKVKIVDYINDLDFVKNLEIDLGVGSSLDLFQFNFGSKENKTRVNLSENSVYNLKSVYYIRGSKSDMINSAIHRGINSNSNLVVNGCVFEGGEVINDGLIEISENSFNCEGHQKMKNLILDENSKVFSEPVLEVKNNDVRCSHGSSISQVKDEILFYVQSRGLSKEEAQNLYVRGFFDFVLEGLDDDFKEKICIEL